MAAAASPRKKINEQLSVALNALYAVRERLSDETRREQIDAIIIRLSELKKSLNPDAVDVPYDWLNDPLPWNQ